MKCESLKTTKLQKGDITYLEGNALGLIINENLELMIPQWREGLLFDRTTESLGIGDYIDGTEFWRKTKI